MTDPGAPADSILLTVAYDGGQFAGFARQPGQRTIAGELLEALQAIDPAVCGLRGVSRTDSGVHAEDQHVAFDPALEIPTKGWVHGVTRHLPPEIAIRGAARVPRGYSPRFDRPIKRYRYTLLFDPVRDPFREGRAWRLTQPLELPALARARTEASALVGTHNFAAFRSSSDERENTTRTIVAAAIERDPGDSRIVHVRIEGDGFLHNMVRIIVGTLVDVARGRLAEGAIQRALSSHQRTDAGITAPPDGLCLERVVLATEARDAWPPRITRVD